MKDRNETQINYVDLSVKSKNIKQELFRRDWFYWGQWKAPILFNSGWVAPIQTRSFQENPNTKDLSGDMFFIDGHYFGLNNDMKIIKSRILNSLDNQGTWFKYVFEFSEKSITQLQNSNNIKEFLYAMIEAIACSLMIHYSDKILNPVIEANCLKLNYPYELFLANVHPFKKTAYLRYKEELNKIKDKSQLYKVKETYSWLFSPIFMNSELTIDKLTEEWNELEIESQNDILPNLNVGVSNKKDVVQKSLHLQPKSSISKTLGFCIGHSIGFFENKKKNNIPSEFSEMIPTLNKLSFYRTALFEEILKKASELLQELRDLSQKMNTSFSEFVNLNFYEVLDYIDSGKPPITKNRSEKDGVISLSKKIYFLDEKNYLTDVTDLYIKKDSSNLVRGAIAFPGLVKGPAKVIFSIQDLNKVKEGDILIAPETMPDFLPAMRKAIAFVTNQGGITSHAAIIAREMKKPCIIATKTATQIIRTGDIVLVDANKGMVKVLKRISE